MLAYIWKRTSNLNHIYSNHADYIRHIQRWQSWRYVFAHEFEDTRHDDVPSHCSAAGLKSSVPARDIIASNFPHNINTLPLDLSPRTLYILSTT